MCCLFSYVAPKIFNTYWRKKYIYNDHENEIADLYCLDCEEIICKKNKSHENHATFNTSKMLNDVNRSRKITKDKTNKSFSTLRLLRLIN